MWHLMRTCSVICTFRRTSHQLTWGSTYVLRKARLAKICVTAQVNRNKVGNCAKCTTNVHDYCERTFSKVKLYTKSSIWRRCTAFWNTVYINIQVNYDIHNTTAQLLYNVLQIMLNSHRRRRRDSAVELSRHAIVKYSIIMSSYCFVQLETGPRQPTHTFTPPTQRRLTG